MNSSSVFEFDNLNAATAASQTSGKLVLIDFTAEWCGPCRAMERTTWADERVTQWLGDHAHPVRIDIDQHEEVAKRFSVRAVPTVIVLRDGDELDRFTGARSAQQFLEWTEGLSTGKTERARLEASATSTDVNARFELVRNLAMASRWADALPHLVWLWTRSLEFEPNWVGVRHSFLLAALKDVIRAHAPAREEFARIRDAANAGAQRGEKDARADWLTLNEALDDVEASLAWFDEAKSSLSPEQARWLSHRLASPLKERGRWADLACLYPNAVAALDEDHQLHHEMLSAEAPPGFDAEMAREMVEEMRSFVSNALREKASDLVRACLAAERHAEALQVAARAKELDASSEMATAVDSPFTE